MSLPENFIWGAATAAAQIEGGWDEEGRTPSIWDVNPDGYVRRNETCHTACDHYHRWREDVEIMKEIGLKAYRFSVSWSRIIPDPGVINEKGLKFYSDLIDALIEAGIEPMITLYHFDLPLWAHEKGGWTTPEIIDDFLFYTETVVKAFSDRVRYWFTFNEPSGFVRDYAARVPGADIKVMTRNVLLAHGRAVSLMRHIADRELQIGLVIAVMNSEPAEGTVDVKEAAAETYSDGNGVGGMAWWSDPAILGIIPDPLKDHISEEDIIEICQPLDFYAGNIYFSANYFDETCSHTELIRPGMPRTACGWPVNDDCIYWFIRFAYERYRLPVFITENGYAGLDRIMLDGKVHDPQRTDYIQRMVISLKKAADEGFPVMGYLYWSLLDNFEWNSGYDMRFGLVYVDYETGARVIKDSAKVYSEMIGSNGGKI